MKLSETLVALVVWGVVAAVGVGGVVSGGMAVKHALVHCCRGYASRVSLELRAE
jgi:hypothetical protein